MSTQVSSKLVNINGREQRAIVIIPDEYTIEALGVWGSCGTPLHFSDSSEMTSANKEALADLLDAIDEELDKDREEVDNINDDDDGMMAL